MKKSFLMVTFLLNILSLFIIIFLLINMNKNSNLRIVNQKTSMEGRLGETIIFAVDAEGDIETYCWQFKTKDSNEWNNFSYGGAATMEKKLTSIFDNMSYRVIIVGKNKDVIMSETGTVKLIDDVVINVQPQDVIGAIGDEVTFSIEAVGSIKSYCWQSKLPQDEDWTNCKNGNKKEIKRTLSSIFKDRSFRVIITDVNGNEYISDECVVNLIE